VFGEEVHIFLGGVRGGGGGGAEVGAVTKF